MKTRFNDNHLHKFVRLIQRDLDKILENSDSPDALSQNLVGCVDAALAENGILSHVKESERPKLIRVVNILMAPHLDFYEQSQVPRTGNFLPRISSNVNPIAGRSDRSWLVNYSSPRFVNDDGFFLGYMLGNINRHSRSASCCDCCDPTDCHSCGSADCGDSVEGFLAAVVLVIVLGITFGIALFALYYLLKQAFESIECFYYDEGFWNGLLPLLGATVGTYLGKLITSQLLNGALTSLAMTAGWNPAIQLINMGISPLKTKILMIKHIKDEGESSNQFFTTDASVIRDLRKGRFGTEVKIDGKTFDLTVEADDYKEYNLDEPNQRHASRHVVAV